MGSWATPTDLIDGTVYQYCEAAVDVAAGPTPKRREHRAGASPVAQTGPETDSATERGCDYLEAIRHRDPRAGDARDCYKDTCQHRPRIAEDPQGRSAWSRSLSQSTYLSSLRRLPAFRS